MCLFIGYIEFVAWLHGFSRWIFQPLCICWQVGSATMSGCVEKVGVYWSSLPVPWCFCKGMKWMKSLQGGGPVTIVFANGVTWSLKMGNWCFLPL